MKNKFQKEVVKRRKKVVKVVGLGDWSLRFLNKLIINRLKKYIQYWIIQDFI